MTPLPLAKPRPKLLDKREQRAALAATDRIERASCRKRSGGRCEVMEYVGPAGWRATVAFVLGVNFRRCPRRASENHHLIGGIGRKNKGRSILAAHRLDVCDRCHEEITGHVLRAVGTPVEREAADTVRYERVR